MSTTVDAAKTSLAQANAVVASLCTKRIQLITTWSTVRGIGDRSSDHALCAARGVQFQLRPLSELDQAKHDEEFAALDAEIETAKAAAKIVADQLDALETAEQLRQHGKIGEIVMRLKVGYDELKTENERFRAALTAAGITIPDPRA